MSYDGTTPPHGYAQPPKMPPPLPPGQREAEAAMFSTLRRGVDPELKAGLEAEALKVVPMAKPLNVAEYQALLEARKNNGPDKDGKDKGLAEQFYEHGLIDRLLATVEVLRLSGADADRNRQLYWNVLCAMAIQRGGWFDVPIRALESVPASATLNVGQVTEGKGGKLKALRVIAKGYS